MWRQLKNIILSFTTYTDLSPDLRIRQQVNLMLSSRPSLTLEEWYEYFWQPQGISEAVAKFIYVRLEQYSGLSMAKVLPSDRLEEDLKLSSVCWFDWNLTCCEDFWNTFHIDISHCLDLNVLNTVEDFILFLNSQLITMRRS